MVSKTQIFKSHLKPGPFDPKIIQCEPFFPKTGTNGNTLCQRITTAVHVFFGGRGFAPHDKNPWIRVFAQQTHMFHPNAEALRIQMGVCHNSRVTIYELQNP